MLRRQLTQLRTVHWAQIAQVIFGAASLWLLKNLFCVPGFQREQVRQGVKGDREVRVIQVYVKTASVDRRGVQTPGHQCCYVIRRIKSDSRSSNSSRQSASAFASGKGVFTETSGVYRERLCNNNFHVRGCGTSFDNLC